jgi:hypothetical protein
MIEPDALDHAVDILRPDAAQATRLASSTATDQPRRATSRATVRPASPAPITQTSTSRSKFRRGRGGLATRVASYQPAAVFSPSLIAIIVHIAAALQWPQARMLDCRRFEIDASASPCPTIQIHQCAAFYCYATPRPNGPSPEPKTFPAS